MPELTKSETESILTLCLMASFADGDKDERERDQIKKLADSLAGSEVDFMALYRHVLMGKPVIAEIAAQLGTTESRQLAYEMAVCVCDADGLSNEAEKQFLAELRTALGLNPATSTAVTTTPFPPTVPATAAPQATANPDETKAMILRYAIFAGALELLPQSLATLAVVPLQTKMVYRIGSQRGYSLDRKSIMEFMATVGIGLVSQAFEGFARKLAKKFGKSIAGGIGGALGSTATGVAISFASTYALGQLAQIYYDSGRTLDMGVLKSKYATLLEEGKSVAGKYTAQIAQQGESLKGANIATLLKGAP
jgi:uncharacterized protein (DUF697 family)/tellurite resistance protein